MSHLYRGQGLSVERNTLRFVRCLAARASQMSGGTTAHATKSDAETVRQKPQSNCALDVHNRLQRMCLCAVMTLITTASSKSEFTIWRFQFQAILMPIEHFTRDSSSCWLYVPLPNFIRTRSTFSVLSAGITRRCSHISTYIDYCVLR